jgi:hypothetical protein
VKFIDYEFPYPHNCIKLNVMTSQYYKGERKKGSLYKITCIPICKCLFMDIEVMMKQLELVPVSRTTMDGGKAIEGALMTPARRTRRLEDPWASQQPVTMNQ